MYWGRGNRSFFRYNFNINEVGPGHWIKGNDSRTIRYIYTHTHTYIHEHRYVYTPSPWRRNALSAWFSRGGGRLYSNHLPPIHPFAMTYTARTHTTTIDDFRWRHGSAFSPSTSPVTAPITFRLSAARRSVGSEKPSVMTSYSPRHRVPYTYRPQRGRRIECATLTVGRGAGGSFWISSYDSARGPGSGGGGTCGKITLNDLLHSICIYSVRPIN